MVSHQSTLSFVKRIQTWQQQSGRHHLPWQNTHDAYRVWLSEIMLQQTQVRTVIPYYERFIKRFPTIADLAQVSQEEVMPYWAGLGYYARARNLHRCAQLVMQQHGGFFPQTPEELALLPGIGKSTANAIAAFCFNASTPIMDGNVKRVFSRFYGITGYGTAMEKQLWQQAYANVQGETEIGRYNQGLMDLGSMVCTRTKPSCTACPLQSDCYAYAHQAQAQFPEKKTKKAIPQRETFMLVIQRGQQILLQQRPAQGIWGGLLSLPELATQQEVNHWLATHPHVSALKMASFEHIFSHYRLLIHPILVTLCPSDKHPQGFVSQQEQDSLKKNAITPNLGLQDSLRRYEIGSPDLNEQPCFFPQSHWYDYRQQLALPSPIAKIIGGLYEGLCGV